MSIIEKIRAKASANIKKIVLPEGDDDRTLRAAEILVNEKLADPVVLGDPAQIAEKAKALGVNVNFAVIDPVTSPDTARYADLLFELRKAKGLTKEAADKLALDPMYHGILMVKAGDADGLVSGAVHTTGDMLRPALQIIKTKPGMKLVSSSFLMDCPDKSLGEDGLLVYADCVVVPNPNAEELANIAVAAADTERDRVPSFSQGTRSFYHRSVDIILYFQSSHNDI